MTILHTVKSYSSLAGGMYEVVRQISENLKKRGHEITIASCRKPDNYSSNINVELFDFSKENEIKRYQDYLIDSDFDIITNFAAQQPMTDLMLPILQKIKAKKVFVPTGFNALQSKTHKTYFENMKTWLAQYDLNIFLSNNYQDINFARINNVPESKITIIPNGASKEEFFDIKTLNIKEKLKINKNNLLILHVGSFTGVKGHYEAIEIFSKANIKNATLLLIGNGDNFCSKKTKEESEKLNSTVSFKKNNKNILIKELNREDTVSVYKESDIFLFPSNTECSPIVLFEAMAAGIPFLTSEVGNTKEIIEWSNGGILLPTYQNIILGENYIEKIKKYLKKFLIRIGFNLWNPDIQYAKVDINKSIKIFEELCLNTKKRKELGNNGREAWLNKFTWEKISERYEAEYMKLLN
ncbi:MAG: glycosyltransferase family 4 protein [bacterium]